MLISKMVSIVVTAYNKEKFIKKCVESILNQTYQNLEVIIIDDGSSDNTFEICDELSSDDLRCILLHQSNCGVSQARNVGLKHVSGEYVLFVDGDDYLDLEYVQSLMKYSKFDLVQSGYRYISKKMGIESRLPNSKIVYGSNKIKPYVFESNVFSYFSVPWSKLYKSEIIKRNSISFENQSYGEDTIFVIKYLEYCNSVITIEQVGYNNLEVSGSLSRRKLYNLWSKLNNILPINSNFIKKYGKEWSFLYFRNIKIYLMNEDENYGDFKNACKIIFRDKNIPNIKLSILSRKSDKIIFSLIEFRMFFMLFIIFKIKDKSRY